MKTGVYDKVCLRTILAITLFATVCGCASFPGKDLPVYDYVDMAPAPEKKLCVVISDKVPKESEKDVEHIIAMFEKSGYFLKSPEHCSPSVKQIDNELKVSFQNDLKFSNLVVAVVSGFVSGATFLLVPGYGRDEYILTVQIKKKDQLIKEYVYHEHMNTWLHVTMLFVIPGHTPGTTVRDIADRMIMNFLYDYSRDIQQGRLASAIQAE